MIFNNLVTHALEVLGYEYKEITLWTREDSIAFSELHGILVDYETFLQRDEESAPVSITHAAYRGKIVPFKYDSKQSRSDWW